MKFPFLNMAQYREVQPRLTSISPYSNFVAPGVMLLKNGALLRTFRLQLPDLESSADTTIASVAAMFNRAVMSLGSSWAVQMDVRRFLTDKYPCGVFSNPAAFLVDARRCEQFVDFGQHFTTDYYISLVYQLPNSFDQKVKTMLIKKDKTHGIPNDTDLINEINGFLRETDKVSGLLSSRVRIDSLTSTELFSLIHASVSTDKQPLILPADEAFFFVDHALFDVDVDNTMPLKLGKYYLPILAVNDFPMSTYPAIFDSLNRLAVEFRWTSRFIPMDKEKSLSLMMKAKKRARGKEKTGFQKFAETTTTYTSPFLNEGAAALAADAGGGEVDVMTGTSLYGYYTSNICTWHTDLDVAEHNLLAISQHIKALGFSCREETYNAFRAWQGMMPGNIYANIHRPPISSTNFSHMLPLSAAWEGLAKNDFLAETSGTHVPHLICSTGYGTPFFMSFNVRDVGHTFIVGPTGAGKSTLLALSAIQSLKYPNSATVFIDKGLSSRAVMTACGGHYVTPGNGEAAFQVLAELKGREECSEADYSEALLWCCDWICSTLEIQGVNVNSAITNKINETLQLLATMSPDARSLTSFCQYCVYSDPITQENTIVDGLAPYAMGGAYGTIFDANSTTLELSKLITIDMEHLMDKTEKVTAPALLYLFRYLEKIWRDPAHRPSVTFLFIDEAWLCLKHPVFANKIQEWLRVLRKFRVFVIFATQEVESAARSELSSTISQQCLTKIYLADESANTPARAQAYRFFGLNDDEIAEIANAEMKKDYFYKSSLGARMFQLDLDLMQLTLISPDHELISELEEKHGRNTGKPLFGEMLDAKMHQLAESHVEQHIINRLDWRPYFQGAML